VVEHDADHLMLQVQSVLFDLPRVRSLYACLGGEVLPRHSEVRILQRIQLTNYRIEKWVHSLPSL
jgi:hypothetical protein